MIKKLIYFIAIFTSITIVSCDDDLASLNVNVTQPNAARTDLMMTGAQRTTFGMLQQRDPIMYVQHLAETQYTSTSTYSNSVFSYTGEYVNALQNLQLIIDLNTDEPTNPDVLAGGSNANQIAAAMTLKSWLIWRMTDRWGYLPYSEALSGVDNLQPKFDSQEEIYNRVFSDLTTAVSMFDEGGSLNGDILLSGNIGKWKTFANSVRMIAALRLSDVAPAKAESEFTAAMSAGVIQSNSENISYQYLDQDGNYSFWYNSRYIGGRRDFAMSETFLGALMNFDDPRLPVVADVALNSQQYTGMPYGLSEANAGAISNNDVSYMSQSNIEAVPNLTFPVITRSTILFAMAEAVERNWISGDAASLYKNAIAASWDQWGATGDIDAYVSQNDVAYNSANWDELIGTQKWIALFLDGQEAWAEWRRLDYPVLTPAVDAQSEDGNIPVRHGYPSGAATLNGDNLAVAIAAQGPDNLSTKLWWDVN